MKKLDAAFGLLRIPMDALAVAAALLLSYRLREAAIDLIPGQQFLEPATTLPPFWHFVETFVLPSILVIIALAAWNGLYTLRATLSAWVEAGKVVLTVSLWLAVVIAWYFLVAKQLFYSRILLFHSTFFLALFLLLSRSALVLLQRGILRKGLGRTVVVSIGVQHIVANVKTQLTADHRYLYIGHLPDLDALQRVALQRSLDLVLQTDPNPAGSETIRLIEYCRSHHIGYGFLPPVLADVPHLLAVEKLGLVPLMKLQPTTLDGWGRIFKRLFDIVVSLSLLTLLSPFLLWIAIVIVIDTGWPAFYVSQRVGQRGHVRIPVLKFRTMIQNADQQKANLVSMNHRADGPLFKVRRDPRVTKAGKLLRRLSLDELPQLLNVLIGQMSLVGPRPHLPDEVSRYNLEQRRVFAVKPGITGLAQVSGRSDLNFNEEVRLDLQYIEEWSIWLDLWILWRTLFTVVERRGDD